MNSFQDYYRKSNGLKSPTQAYAFMRSGSKAFLLQSGVPVTRNAYSANQAIRYIKQAFPSLQHVDLIAKPYKAQSVQVAKPECNSCELTKPQPPAQLGLSI